VTPQVPGFRLLPDTAVGQIRSHWPYDPVRARQLLAEAGLASSPPAIKLVYWGNYPEEAALAEAMQPMLNAVGFNASVEKIDRVEYNRRINNKGYANSIMFFGPGGRVTSLSGSYFAYTGALGPTQDQEVQSALARATGAATLEEYMAATAEIARHGHERAYSPGFFAASSIFFVRKGIEDWGLKRSVYRWRRSTRHSSLPILSQKPVACICEQ
jgi:ABC-type transport system substrate-binding protein